MYHFRHQIPCHNTEAIYHTKVFLANSDNFWSYSKLLQIGLNMPANKRWCIQCCVTNNISRVFLHVSIKISLTSTALRPPINKGASLLRSLYFCPNKINAHQLISLCKYPTHFSRPLGKLQNFFTIASTTMTTFNIAELHQIAIAVFLVKTGKMIVTFTGPTPVFTLQLLLRQTIWLQPPFFSIVTWHLGHSCIRRILKMPVTTYNALKSEGKCYIKDFQRWKVN